MNKLEKKKQVLQLDLKKRLKGFNNKTIGTRELLEYAIKNASLYKYQKYLLLVETVAKLEDGELQD